jgi:hypothetical protein
MYGQGARRKADVLRRSTRINFRPPDRNQMERPDRESLVARVTQVRGVCSRIAGLLRLRNRIECTLLVSHPGKEAPMCDKCAELDGKIEHLKALARRITDGAMMDTITQLVQEHQARKLELHPEDRE